MFLGSTEPELEVGVLRSGRIFRSGKLKWGDGILVCSKEANMKFGHAKMKGLAMKRRTTARSRKDLKILRTLRRHRDHSTTT